ncbi:uncharacterized protein LOC141832912 [Curcuma longa]|uniref:uncharacterized protein LOC141832912 n=1 Tax=Curcuma longa TaxID=136217 RepID=UPI003D9EEBCA
MAVKPASSNPGPPPPPPPPPAAAKRGLLYRSVPFLLAANFAVGAYVLLRTNKKPPEKGEETGKEVPDAPVVTTEPVTTGERTVDAPVPSPTKVLPPIAEQEQRELFKWILEEKRKLKPSNRDEKKKIDEEKALLKQLIRTKTIPSI